LVFSPVKSTISDQKSGTWTHQFQWCSEFYELILLIRLDLLMNFNRDYVEILEFYFLLLNWPWTRNAWIFNIVWCVINGKTVRFWCRQNTSVVDLICWLTLSLDVVRYLEVIW
jgi:hypothetical protein